MKKKQYFPSHGCIRCLGSLHNGDDGPPAGMDARSLRSLANRLRASWPAPRHPSGGAPLCRRQFARSLSLALHLATLLRDGPLRRPQRRYTALAGGSACPVATAPYLPIARIPLSRRGR